MKIEIIDDQSYLSKEAGKIIKDVIELTANHLGLKEYTEVDITIVDNTTIHQLNNEYRGVDRATDVLSFAMLDEVEGDFISLTADMMPVVHLGDIIISNDKVIEQAKEYGHSYERELGFLTVHGFLHLNGYDHQTPEESSEMFGLQEEILTQYGLTR
ncbi:rRNA maturation RNase YbeY [Aerococcaceae bacterium DSM 111022]|nr:rRNA maturation RNase YbeY [Aerococcaceae bacterium DSM 111022]